MTKSKARAELAVVVAGVNNRTAGSEDYKFRAFLRQVFLPFYRRRWKPSTTMTNEDRFKNHLILELGDRVLTSITRDEMQSLLDRQAAAGFSFSLVGHLRWDLKQIFELAVAEGFLQRNPASPL
jgi:hypothetical protein